MTTVTYSELRQNLALYLDKTEQDREEVVVTRSKGRRSVILSLDDFNALQETAYLLSSRANRKHLETSISEASKDKKRVFTP